MCNINVNEYFKNSYLTCGSTRDNFIFENCPLEFIELAYESLKESSNSVKSCCIRINQQIERELEYSLEKCKDNIQKNIIARDFLIAIFVYELLKNNEINDIFNLEVLKKGILDILSGDLKKAKEFCLNGCPVAYDIKKIINKIGKIELNIFLININNVYLQKAINNFICSREPYSIKLFANKKLSSYADQMGNLIQAPHDYISINVNKFIDVNNKKV